MSETFKAYKAKLRRRATIRKQGGIFDRFRDPVKGVQNALQGFDWSPFNPDVCQAQGCEQPTEYHWRHPGDWYDKYLCGAHHAEDLEHRDNGYARPEEQQYTISPYQSDGIGPRPVEWTYGQ